MSETNDKDLLSGGENGDNASPSELFLQVYDDLREVAAAMLAKEPPGQSLQPTALVHEAYLRLVVAGKSDVNWQSRRHFFGAAAEAMRRILVDNARRKARLKAGGDTTRQQLDETHNSIAVDDPEAFRLDLLDLDEALEELSEQHPAVAELVRLRFFAGLSMDAAAELLGISSRSCYYTWSFARSWLKRRLRSN